ncbi:efflux RND transporter periplasmic adaptor subunit [Granulicella arctica]|uniref:Multidrug efflux system membrane fusion protein n=1 Tax=Granulicella arctica TaxID=940613 RepID=A0A7Y9PFU9_9BACT|nr:biotin/lipoyl-binding protein [Granulicella arctica]NYF79037.1 multidrug efflux system membrane fusion protein [Granulicella arctica]
MPNDPEVPKQRRMGRVLQLGVVSLTAVLLVLVLLATDRHPRTDDASVRANLIEIAPEVSGRLEQLPVKDNMFVKQGGLLFVIDPRDYEYALRQALSDQDNLEQRIADARRKIAAQDSAVGAARAAVHNTTTGVKTAGSGIDLAQATVARAKAATNAAEARWKYAQNDLHRLEPLLAKQYVTIDQVDVARTAADTARGAYDEALAALNEAQAQETQAQLRQQSASDQAAQSEALLGQAMHVVDTLDILMSQRPALAAKVDRARLDLDRCRVVAPFDAYVTNMNISEGAYAKPGAPMFTLIDARNWYVIANYREGKVKNIHIGDPVDLYLMGHPDKKFHGKVDSVGFGVLPEDGKVFGGLPDVDRTLNWVHLSTRFPVRIHVEDPDPELFRIGATAVTVVR